MNILRIMPIAIAFFGAMVTVASSATDLTTLGHIPIKGIPFYVDP
jgi:hypothetical protein